MNWYLVIPLSAAVLLFVFGCVILAIGVRQRVNRLAGALLIGGGWWACCEVLWNVATSTDVALMFHRAAIPGFVFIGPLALHLAGEVAETRARWLQRVVPVGYAFSLVLLGLGLLSPWFITDMVRTGWGNGLVPGPLFGIWFVFTVVAAGAALLSFAQGIRHSTAEVDRIRGASVTLLTTLPFLAAAVSDAILPLLGHQTPRIASLCLASFGGILVWSLHRYGYSLLSYRDFARRILRTLPDGLMLTSLNGRVRLANEKMESLLGCEAGGAIGLSLSEVLDVSLLDPPRDVHALQCELRTDAGAAIPVLISSSLMMDNDENVIGVVVILSDQREVVGLRNRVITSGRLAAVGQLAAGIAHEINNPLAFVRSNLAWLQGQWDGFLSELVKLELSDELIGETDDWKDLLSESLEGVDRAVTIVRDVKEFSHAGTGAHEPTDLNDLLERVLRMARSEIGLGIDVVLDFSTLPLVPCQPQRIKQLFLNLIVNAAHAIEGEGRITLRTQVHREQVVVLVEDDGCGIPEEEIERIFDPFFTTKDVGVGTGLGLAISHEIARGHGGDIRAERGPESGSIFRVDLPCAAESCEGV
jgi:PAS domain S-box-containing protein